MQRTWATTNHCSAQYERRFRDGRRNISDHTNFYLEGGSKPPPTLRAGAGQRYVGMVDIDGWVAPLSNKMNWHSRIR